MTRESSTSQGGEDGKLRPAVGVPESDYPYWLLDPLCDTRSFRRSHPPYSCNLALVPRPPPHHDLEIRVRTRRDDVVPRSPPGFDVTLKAGGDSRSSP